MISWALTIQPRIVANIGFKKLSELDYRRWTCLEESEFVWYVAFSRPLSSSEIQGQLFGRIECSWWKFTVNFQWTFTTNRFYPLDQLPLGLRGWWETVTVVAVYVNDNFGKGNISLTSKSLSDHSINSQFTFYEVFSHRMAAVTSCENTMAPMERFHMTSQRPYWCSKTMKRRPCLCSELILSIRQLYPIWLNT